MTSPSYMPHGWCFAWDPQVFWPSVTGNIGTALAYATIPALLLWIRRRRPDLMPRLASLPFSIFIASCGLGHLLDIIVLWYPLYRLQAWWTVTTAVSSLATAAVVWRARRQVLGLVSSADLERAIQRAEAAERQAEELSGLLDERRRST